MENTKMTKKAIITAMLADEVIKENETYVTFLTRELELLNKKNSNKVSKAQKEVNDKIEAGIMAVLDDTLINATEIVSKLAQMGIVTSTQKVSPIMHRWAKEGLVELVVDKRKNYYKLPDVDESKEPEEPEDAEPIEEE